jgi:hypothetical protein
MLAIRGSVSVLIHQALDLRHRVDHVDILTIDVVVLDPCEEFPTGQPGRIEFEREGPGLDNLLNSPTETIGILVRADLDFPDLVRDETAQAFLLGPSPCILELLDNRRDPLRREVILDSPRFHLVSFLGLGEVTLPLGRYGYGWGQ